MTKRKPTKRLLLAWRILNRPRWKIVHNGKTWLFIKESDIRIKFKQQYHD
jgi:hypothetical protein